jgi:DNA primase
LALDGDDPGAKATLRAWGALQQVEGPVEAARLPEGTDPADILRYHGFGGVREALHSVVPLADLVVDATIERAGGELEHAENRLAAARAAAALITQLKPHEVARQVARVADRTGLAISDMTAVLTAAVSPDVPPGDVATATEDFPSAPLARIGPATGQKERPPQPAEATRRVTSPRSSQGRTT